MQQMICKCLALVFSSSVFKLARVECNVFLSWHVAIYTHAATCLYVCVCVHCACVALCDCSVQLFWRHVLIIKHRCHKHSHHTHAQTLALSCNKHLVVYPVNCWTRSSGQCCTVKRVCISLMYAWQKCFYISFHVEWSIFYGCGRSSFKIIIICNSLININNY